MKCPTCSQPVRGDEPTRPFCSKRCRLVDLDRWLTGDYRIAGPTAIAPGSRRSVTDDGAGGEIPSEGEA
ncbi:MAG: DNA gyrase inhibitor YacG [Alphaproteobacteria bacterium]|nr:DNA gyrase inhibitor YacG [Alphaproteobacteria bacterium]MCB9695804.1 DNA gyrase inhibitor YacG [Alphaproteobacteria bacterium]